MTTTWPLPVPDVLTVPDCELTVVGRMDPVVASCLPGLRPVELPPELLHLLVSNPSVLLEIRGILADHHLAPLDIRIDHDQLGLSDHSVPAKLAAL